MLPSRTAGIDAGGHAVGQALLIGVQPAAKALVCVQVDVDEARRHIVSRHVQGLGRFAVYIRTHGGDLSVFYGYVGQRIDTVFRIDDVAAF